MRVWHIVKKEVVKIDMPDWAKVHGPVGTVIANLVRIGWQPNEPGLWLDETGEAWEFSNFEKPLDWSAIEEKLLESCRKTLDNQAAKHRFGEGAKAKTEAEHEAEADRIYKDGKQREAAKERKLKLEAEEREKALVTGRPDTTASQKKVAAKAKTVDEMNAG